MLAVLLESRTPRRRRNGETTVGGAAFSVAAHLAILAATVATTMRATMPRAERPKPVALSYLAPPPPPPAVPKPAVLPPAPALQRRMALPASQTMMFTILRLPSPRAVAPPTIDFAQNLSSRHAADGPPTPTGSLVRSIVGAGDDRPSNGPWRGSELTTRIVTSATPLYPDMLRLAGVEGSVLIEFAIDTTGRILIPTVEVLQSTHDQFTRAVMEALPRFRFRPAESGGHPILSFAQMPFEFRIPR